jgi:hypothetical protein
MLDADRKNKSLAVKKMIKLFHAYESSHFHVVLKQYYIDKEPYSASALTVSRECTPNLAEALNGFQCDSFFPPNMLDPKEKEGKEVINGVIKVSMYVNLDDVFGIFDMATQGEPIPLYAPPDE